MITIRELTMYRLGIQPEDTRNLSGADFARAGLSIMGGCEGCGASLAAYNAYPQHSGYWACRDCAVLGWDTVEEANADIFQGEMPSA